MKFRLAIIKNPPKDGCFIPVATRSFGDEYITVMSPLVTSSKTSCLGAVLVDSYAELQCSEDGKIWDTVPFVIQEELE